MKRGRDLYRAVRRADRRRHARQLGRQEWRLARLNAKRAVAGHSALEELQERRGPRPLERQEER